MQGVLGYLHPSTIATTANIRKGSSLPPNWYMTPPKGGPTKKKKKHSVLNTFQLDRKCYVRWKVNRAVQEFVVY